GLLLNSILLYAIRKFSRTNLGAYKHLLTIFAAVDVFLVIFHVAVRPVSFFSKISIDWDKLIVQRITALYAACQSVPFTLLGIHFLYRYWCVRRPQKIALFSNWKFAFFLAFLTIGGVCAWYAL
ncbi:hypothetical protein PMAYCL1PPCAC_16079, partial [Pristionchus mayeri]